MYQDWKQAILNINDVAVIAKATGLKPLTVDGWIKEAMGKKGGKTPKNAMRNKIIALANEPQQKTIVRIPKKVNASAVSENKQAEKPNKTPKRPISIPIPPKGPRKEDDDLEEALRGLNIRAEDVFRVKPNSKGCFVNYRHILCFVTNAGQKHFWNLLTHRESTVEDYQKKIL